MIISSKFAQFHNSALLLLKFLKFFCNILDSLKLRKSQTLNTKVMAKDLKVNISSYIRRLPPKQLSSLGERQSLSGLI